MSTPDPTNITTVLVTERPETRVIGDGGSLPVTRHRNIAFVVMTPLAQALVRAARTFLQSLVAFLLLALAGKSTLASVGVIVAPEDFLHALGIAAGLAVAPTVISLLQNLVEIFGKFDEMFPKLRA